MTAVGHSNGTGTVSVLFDCPGHCCFCDAIDTTSNPTSAPSFLATLDPTPAPSTPAPSAPPPPPSLRDSDALAYSISTQYETISTTLSGGPDAEYYAYCLEDGHLVRAPSAAPTASPAPTTVSPSTAPTGAPSALPSGAPSACPSGSPSSAPSTAPSSSPTPAPSPAPSPLPSTSPSAAPSGNPTTPPSPAPSQTPTSYPSFYCDPDQQFSVLLAQRFYPGGASFSNVKMVIWRPDGTLQEYESRERADVEYMCILESPGCFVAEFQFEDPSTSADLSYSLHTDALTENEAVSLTIFESI